VVIEKEASRDHTERMLRHFGAEVSVGNEGAHAAASRSRPARTRARAGDRAGGSVVRGVFRWSPR